MTGSKKIRVLIVDDSSLMRKAISDVLGRDPEIEVVGTALDPYIAREKILSLKPDVMTLDIDMPRMDGLTFLRILMEHHPMPIVILSSLSQDGSEKAIEALTAGAVDVMPKPGSSSENTSWGPAFTNRIKAAAQARKFGRLTQQIPQPIPLEKDSLGTGTEIFHPRQLILMGASTGGIEALIHIISHLRPKLPGICIVQHIPIGFSRAFAQRLSKASRAEVREAVEGDIIHPGLILVAPSDQHLLLDWRKDHYTARLNKGVPVWHQRPSVDVLFNSVAESATEFTTAILLTGMGKDGAEGMKKLRDHGAHTIAQSQESCAIFGMPRAAIELGAATEVLSLEQIPPALLNRVTKQGKTRS